MCPSSVVILNFTSFLDLKTIQFQNQRADIGLFKSAFYGGIDAAPVQRCRVKQGIGVRFATQAHQGRQQAGAGVILCVH